MATFTACKEANKEGRIYIVKQASARMYNPSNDFDPGPTFKDELQRQNKLQQECTAGFDAVDLSLKLGPGSKSFDGLMGVRWINSIQQRST